MTRPAAPRSPWRAIVQSPALVYGGLLLALWSRLVRLEALPIYWDEAFHIYYARVPLLQHHYFAVFPYARWLNVMLIALLQPLGMESLWISRGLSILLSLVTAACAYGVGRWLGSRTTGRLALLLYAIMPFAFFYDRQALSDPVMAAFGALSVVFSLRALRSLSLRDAVLSGLCVALTALSKFAGALYLPFILVGALLLPVADRRRAVGLALAQAAVAASLFGAVFILAQLQNRPAQTPAGTGNWCHSPLCFGQISVAQFAGLTATNIRQYLDTIPTFYTPGVYGLAAAAVLLSARRRRRQILLLGVLAFALALPYILIADLFPPRYLMFTLLPAAALAAHGFEQCLPRVRKIVGSRSIRLGWIGPAGLAIITFAPALVLDIWQVASPLTAPMPIWEFNQYSAGWPNGLTARAIAGDLYQRQKQTGERINLLAGAFYLELYAYWGERLGQVRTTRDVTEQTYIPWLASNAPLCLVEMIPREPLGATPFGMIVQPVRVYDVPGSADHPEQFGGPAHATLECVTGTTEPLTTKIADYVFGDPSSAAAFYETLPGLLQGFAGPVLLYPPNQLALVQSLPGLGASDLRPIGGSWPVRLDDIAAEIAGAADSAGEVRVVMALEDRGDPRRQVEGWLNAHLFPVDVQYSGPVRVLRFLTARDSPSAAVAVDIATFPSLARLAQAAVLDPIVPPSRLVRVMLSWEPALTPTLSYKVFAHVFDGQGQLVAQHDGYPQAEFAPTTVWQPGQVVTDRFVVYFPLELPPGSYVVKTGFYDAATGSRLTSAGGDDSIPIGTVTVP